MSALLYRGLIMLDEAGAQSFNQWYWIPASAGMTKGGWVSEVRRN